MNDQKQLISSLGEEMTIRQKRTMIFFIEATKHILQEDGYDHLTIREIAQRAGYNAATLYHYFRDLDELIIYGSVGFLSDYVRLLACRIKHSMTALQKYQTIYACFNEVAFVWPRVFYHMFFGNHHVDLGQVISTYYKVLYPEELQKIPDLALREMLQRGTLFERDEVMMDELVAEGTIRREDAALTLETIIALHDRYLHQASLLKKEDPRPLEEAFQNVFLFVLEKISVKSSVSR